jgi:hypothetical protein
MVFDLMKGNKMALIYVEGYWQEDPTVPYDVLISTDEWDGNEDDNHIFYYTDGESLKVGDIIDDGFVITSIGR